MCANYILTYKVSNIRNIHQLKWFVHFIFPWIVDMCLLSADIYEYNFVSQGKVTIPNVDDGEEFTLTDVSFLEQAYIPQFSLGGGSR